MDNINHLQVFEDSMSEADSEFLSEVGLSDNNSINATLGL